MCWFVMFCLLSSTRNCLFSQVNESMIPEWICFFGFYVTHKFIHFSSIPWGKIQFQRFLHLNEWLHWRLGTVNYTKKSVCVEFLCSTHVCICLLDLKNSCVLTVCIRHYVPHVVASISHQIIDFLQIIDFRCNDTFKIKHPRL